jgi:hypothetical protein
MKYNPPRSLNHYAVMVDPYYYSLLVKEDFQSRLMEVDKDILKKVSENVFIHTRLKFQYRLKSLIRLEFEGYNREI